MARRSFLFMLFVLCFGLSVPALAGQGGGGGNNDGGGNGNGNGQGGGPPTTSATATTIATTTTADTTTSNGNGNGNGNGNNGNGGGPPTTAATATTIGNGNGNGQGGGPPTTTAPTTGNGNGQGGGPPVTDTTANGNANGTGNGQGNGQRTTTPPRTATTARQAPIVDPVAANDDPGRVATFLAASQIPVEADTASASPPTSEGQSAPERIISWLLTGNEQRFLPIVASPFVALMVVGRALTSAGSGAIAPVVLLGAVGFTKLLDRRRAKSLVPIAILP